LAAKGEATGACHRLCQRGFRRIFAIAPLAGQGSGEGATAGTDDDNRDVGIEVGGTAGKGVQ
jgi:hypothetical protein